MNKYIVLLKDFVTEKKSAEEFEEQFLQLFKNESDLLSPREFQILDQLFSDVDAYCSNPELIEDPWFDLSEAQLRVSARNTLDKLVKLTSV
ncbi:MAG: hypothetical protein BRC42_03955 [Cyanobacteria bacterium QS_1_48_34]|nr:MAG: hypothetical protein BRC42_03955 [Cyanobacteria bacterium QS_1_48_34]